MPRALEQVDGSWAWVVLLAAVLTQGLTLGFPSCIGIFFTELQHDFQASNSETSWFPSILVAMLHAGGLLLDATNNFSYLFYLSTFILVLTALFMGGSFYVLQKREQGRQSKAQGDTPKDKDTPEKQLCPENTNVTNL
ncbi:monocarboxylate transporter 6 isoform X2 [Ochotona curzoniae]|uniref:monocarboxylate transporter 6 isoform X2 n=1 Tax=Ochotona curzoniae TaxID=130825 RepID=UPI001B34ED6A|nr:monocarboxylate transporter 6 isoform X2 [Ochotona curzoniae]